MSNQKRMAFYEIGKGRFAQWMQEEFERSQNIALNTGEEVKICAVVTVKPPAKEDECFGQVNFTIKVIRPTKKSMDYTTELHNGMIISDGDDVADILQESLEFPEITESKKAYNG